MRPILITGFEPFAGLSYNPSEALLDLLPDELCDRPVYKAVLPVNCRRLPQALDMLYAYQPALVLHTGLALPRSVLSVERLAVNRLDFDEVDNAGNLIREMPVVAAAKAELSARLPVSEILAALGLKGIPAEESSWAGTFLCNQALFYGLYHLPETIPVGFIHLAPDERLSRPTQSAHQPIRQQAQAVRIAVEVSLAGGKEKYFA